MTTMQALRPIKNLGRTEQTRLSLTKLCRSLGPKARLPTVRDIACSLHVSLSTLDRVLSEMEQDGLIVRRHGRGLFVAEASAATKVAFVTGMDPLLADESVCGQMLAASMRRRVTEAGQAFGFYLDPAFDNHGLPSRSDFMQDVSKGLIAGAIVTATSHPDDLLWMKARHLPFVAFTECPYAEHRFQTDYPWLVERALEMLVARGRRRLCLVAWSGGGGQFDACAAAFRQTVARLGLENPPHAVWQGGMVEGEARRSYGARAVREVFQAQGAGDRFDGIVCTDDTFCASIVPALQELGLRVGRDVSIVTHANKGSPLLESCRADVIPLEFDLDALTGRMLAALDELRAGRDPGPFVIPVRPELPV